MNAALCTYTTSSTVYMRRGLGWQLINAEAACRTLELRCYAREASTPEYVTVNLKQLNYARYMSHGVLWQLNADDANSEHSTLFKQSSVDEAHRKHHCHLSYLSNYLQQGMYAIQLQRWKEAFGARLLVVRGTICISSFNRILMTCLQN